MEVPKEIMNIIMGYKWSMEEYEMRMMLHDEFYMFWNLHRREQLMQEFRNTFYPDFLGDIIPDWVGYELVFITPPPMPPDHNSA